MTDTPEPSPAPIRPRQQPLKQEFSRGPIGEELLEQVFALLTQAEAEGITIITPGFELSSPSALSELPLGADATILGVSASRPYFSLEHSFEGGPVKLYIGDSSPTERQLFDAVVSAVRSAEALEAPSDEPIRRRHSRVERVKHVRLFLEELREVAELVSQLELPTLFSTPDFEYRNLDSLVATEQPASIKNLKISTENGDLTIDLNNPVSVLLGRDRPEVLGVIAQVKDVLDKSSSAEMRKTLIGYAIAASVLAAASVAVGFAISLVAGLGAAALGAWLVFTVPFLWGFRDTSSTPTVRLQMRSEAPGFFLRNRDQLLIAVITAVLAVLATLVVTGIVG